MQSQNTPAGGGSEPIHWSKAQPQWDVTADTAARVVQPTSNSSSARPTPEQSSDSVGGGGGFPLQQQQQPGTENDVVAVSWSRPDERRLRELEVRIAAAIKAQELKQRKDKATNGEPAAEEEGGNNGGAAVGAMEAPEEDTDDGFDMANDTCDAVGDQQREVAIPEGCLSPSEVDELKELRARQKVFEDEGVRRLKAEADRRSQMLAKDEGWLNNAATSTGAAATSITKTAGAVAGMVGTGAKVMGAAGLFWGSLVATAVPAAGRKMGLTSGYEHWNWIDEQLILGAMPVVTQVGSSGNHLELLKSQLRGSEPPAGDQGAAQAQPEATATQQQPGAPPPLVDPEAKPVANGPRKATKLGLVVACLSEIEIGGFGVGLIEFSGAKHWQDTFGNQLEYLHLPMPDMTADVDVSAVADAVDRMQNTMKNRGQACYVHCKAGKGRSWMVVICYLIVHMGMSFEDAVNFVRLRRHQVSPSAAQMNFARDFAGHYAKLRTAEPTVGLVEEQPLETSVAQSEERHEDGAKEYDPTAAAPEIPEFDDEPVEAAAAPTESASNGETSAPKEEEAAKES